MLLYWERKTTIKESIVSKTSFISKYLNVFKKKVYTSNISLHPKIKAENTGWSLRKRGKGRSVHWNQLFSMSNKCGTSISRIVLIEAFVILTPTEHHRNIVQCSRKQLSLESNDHPRAFVSGMVVAGLPFSSSSRGRFSPGSCSPPRQIGRRMWLITVWPHVLNVFVYTAVVLSVYTYTGMNVADHCLTTRAYYYCLLCLCIQQWFYLYFLIPGWTWQITVWSRVLNVFVYTALVLSVHTYTGMNVADHCLITRAGNILGFTLTSLK